MIFGHKQGLQISVLTPDSTLVKSGINTEIPNLFISSWEYRGCSEGVRIYAWLVRGCELRQLGTGGGAAGAQLPGELAGRNTILGVPSNKGQASKGYKPASSRAHCEMMGGGRSRVRLDDRLTVAKDSFASAKVNVNIYFSSPRALFSTWFQRCPW